MLSTNTVQENKAIFEKFDLSTNTHTVEETCLRTGTVHRTVNRLLPACPPAGRPESGVPGTIRDMIGESGVLDVVASVFDAICFWR